MENTLRNLKMLAYLIIFLIAMEVSDTSFAVMWDILLSDGSGWSEMIYGVFATGAIVFTAFCSVNKVCEIATTHRVNKMIEEETVEANALVDRFLKASAILAGKGETNSKKSPTEAL